MENYGRSGYRQHTKANYSDQASHHKTVCRLGTKEAQELILEVQLYWHNLYQIIHPVALYEESDVINNNVVWSSKQQIMIQGIEEF